MATVVQDVSGDSALQTAIAALKAKIEGAEESGDIAQAVSQINKALAGKQNTLTFDSAPSSGSSNPVTSGGVKTALDDMYSEISDRMAAAEEDIDIRGGAIYESASGSLVEIADGADDLPMKSCVVSIEPIQEGSGDPSPDNVRPISGRTGLSVVRAGKNLLPANSFTSTTKQGLTYTVNDDGTVSVSGTATASSYIAIQTSFPEDVIINGVPEINGVAVTGTSVQVYSDVSGIGGYIRSNDTSMVIPANCTIVIRLRIDGDTTVENALFKPMARISADTDYSFEPYKGSTYSVNWETEAGTVYGGTLDVVSGKLTVDKVFKEFADSTDWEVLTTSNIFRNSIYTTKIKPPASNSVPVDAITNEVTITRYRYEIMKENYPSFSVNTNGFLYLAISDDVSTLEELSAWLTEHPLQIAYELATPIEYQLTPQEIHTLLGENNIWSNGGDVTVEYPADTKMYIDNKIAEAIAVALA